MKTIAEVFRDAMKRINEIDKPEFKAGIEECDTCGQMSRLKGGLCDWCQKVYEANK